MRLPGTHWVVYSWQRDALIQEDKEILKVYIASCSASASVKQNQRELWGQRQTHSRARGFQHINWVWDGEKPGKGMSDEVASRQRDVLGRRSNRHLWKTAPKNSGIYISINKWTLNGASLAAPAGLHP